MWHGTVFTRKLLCSFSDEDCAMPHKKDNGFKTVIFFKTCMSGWLNLKP